MPRLAVLPCRSLPRARASVCSSADSASNALSLDTSTLFSRSRPCASLRRMLATSSAFARTTAASFARLRCSARSSCRELCSSFICASSGRTCASCSDRSFSCRRSSAFSFRSSSMVASRPRSAVDSSAMSAASPSLGTGLATPSSSRSSSISTSCSGKPCSGYSRGDFCGVVGVPISARLPLPPTPPMPLTPPPPPLSATGDRCSSSSRSRAFSAANASRCARPASVAERTSSRALRSSPCRSSKRRCIASLSSATPSPRSCSSRSRSDRRSLRASRSATAACRRPSSSGAAAAATFRRSSALSARSAARASSAPVRPPSPAYTCRFSSKTSARRLALASSRRRSASSSSGSNDAATASVCVQSLTQSPSSSSRLAASLFAASAAASSKVSTCACRPSASLHMRWYASRRRTRSSASRSASCDARSSFLRRSATSERRAALASSKRRTVSAASAASSAAAAAAAAPQPEAPAEPDADQRMAASLASLSAGAGLATLDVCMELVQAVLRRPYDARSREMLVDPLRHPLLDLRPLPRMGIDVQDTNSPPAAASASASSDERLLRLPFTVPPLDAHALYRSARAASLHLLLSPGVLPETLRSGGGCTAAFVSLLLRYSYNALHSRRTAIPLTNENSRLLWDAGEGLLLSAGGELHSSPASSADGSGGSGGSNGAVPVLHLPCRAAAVLHSVGRVLHACKAETCSLHVVEGFGQLLGEGAGGGACGGSVVCSLAEVEEGVARTVLQSSVSPPQNPTLWSFSTCRWSRLCVWRSGCPGRGGSSTAACSSGASGCWCWHAASPTRRRW
eukprot:Rhum_TRINITY_DN14235_c4_g1::Rhum_TRINITY_DN14235_c4_g1_i1::g.74574::m.74574